MNNEITEVSNIEYDISCNGADISITIFGKKYETKRAYQKAGYGNISIPTIGKIKLIVFREVESGILSVAVPKAKGEKFATASIEEEVLVKINTTINQEEEDENLKDVPWENNMEEMEL